MISIHQYETFLSFWKRNKNINMLKMISMAADVASTENLARKKWWQHPSHYEFCDLIFDVNIDYDFHFLSHSTSDIFVLAQMSKIIQSNWPFGISIKYTFIQNHCKTTVCRKRAIVFFKNEFARKKKFEYKTIYSKRNVITWKQFSAESFRFTFNWDINGCMLKTLATFVIQNVSQRWRRFIYA